MMRTIEPTELFIVDQEDFFKDLGKRLSELRKERGLTQVQLAELSNCSQQLIASYEAGRLNIPVWRLLSIADALGLSLDDILKGPPSTASRKRGPASKLERLTDQINKLPRSRQRFVVEMIENAVSRAQ
jgi:transcriptional regulator with XRE-family HTH domain